MINSQNQEEEEESLQTILLSSSASSSDAAVNSDALTGSPSNYQSTLTSSAAFHHPLAASSGDSTPDDQQIEVSEKIEISEKFEVLEKNEVFEKIVEAPIKSDYLRISVSDPKKEVESSDSYVTYLISTETDFEGFKGREFRVRRRFRDVVALSERLSEVYRGFFVPSRPDKSVVEGQVMQKQEFVEQRRVAVERYLRRLGKHPVIGRGEELRVFLVEEGRLEFGRSEVARRLSRDEAMVRGDLGDGGKRGGDWMRLFREVKQRVTVDWGGGKVVMEEEDEGFLEKKERLSQLEKQLSNASKQVVTWVLF